jgi:hypothetical protein
MVMREHYLHRGAMGSAPAGYNAHIASWVAQRTMNRAIERAASLFDLVPYETRWHFDAWPSEIGGPHEIVAIVNVRFKDRYPSRKEIPWTVAA